MINQPKISIYFFFSLNLECVTTILKEMDLIGCKA